jgi:hypothetical protein
VASERRTEILEIDIGLQFFWWRAGRQKRFRARIAMVRQRPAAGYVTLRSGIPCLLNETATIMATGAQNPASRLLHACVSRSCGQKFPAGTAANVPSVSARVAEKTLNASPAATSSVPAARTKRLTLLRVSSSTTVRPRYHVVTVHPLPAHRCAVSCSTFEGLQKPARQGPFWYSAARPSQSNKAAPA